MYQPYMEIYLTMAVLVALMLAVAWVSFLTIADSACWDMIRERLEGTLLHDASVPTLVVCGVAVSIFYSLLWIFTIPVTALFIVLYSLGSFR